VRKSGRENTKANFEKEERIEALVRDGTSPIERVLTWGCGQHCPKKVPCCCVNKPACPNTRPSMMGNSVGKYDNNEGSSRVLLVL